MEVQESVGGRLFQSQIDDLRYNKAWELEVRTLVENKFEKMSELKLEVEEEPTAEILGGMIELGNVKSVLIDITRYPKATPS